MSGWASKIVPKNFRKDENSATWNAQRFFFKKKIFLIFYKKRKKRIIKKNNQAEQNKL